jgi:hypothetical protein
MLVQQIHDSLTHLQDKFPDYQDTSTYALSGLVLNLGEQDGDTDLYAEYLPLLLVDLRKELGSPDLPTILVGSGTGGLSKPDFPGIITVQQAIAAMPRFSSSVSYVETRDFWPPEGAREAYRHPAPERWYDNAKSFYEMGEAIGLEFLQLLKK